jgi:hypothetical protein
LTLKPWQDAATAVAEAASAILSTLGVTELLRINFRGTGFLDLGMSHEEMVDQLFGSYLPERAQFAGLGTKLYDQIVGLWGERDGRRFRLQLTPQKGEDVVTTFKNIPNLGAFTDDRLAETQVQDAAFAVGSGPAMNVDAEVFAEKASVTQAPVFARDGLKWVDDLTSDAMDLFRSIPRRKGK